MQADAPNAVTDESDSLGRARDLGGILLWQARENVKGCVCVCVSSLWLGDGGWLSAQRSEAQSILRMFFSGRLGSGRVGSGESACILRNRRAPKSKRP